MYLAGMCTSALMKRDIILPPVSLDEADDDMESIEEAAETVRLFCIIQIP